MFNRSILAIFAMTMAIGSVAAMFDHGPKYGSSSQFKPVYLNPYGSKYESYGKYDDHKDSSSHYQPSYYHDSYEPKYYGSGSSQHGGNDYYSSYQPSHQPYYGSSYYNNEQPKYNDYHATQNYYDKY